MGKFIKNVAFYLLIIFIAISAIDYFSQPKAAKQEMNYTDFLAEVDKGDVSKVVLVENTIKGT